MVGGNDAGELFSRMDVGSQISGCRFIAVLFQKKAVKIAFDGRVTDTCFFYSLIDIAVAVYIQSKVTEISVQVGKVFLFPLPQLPDPGRPGKEKSAAPAMELFADA